MISLRPCGACVALVPADTGCEHWKPGISAARARAERHKARQRADLDQLLRIQSRGSKT